MKPVKLSFAVALVLAAMPLVSFAQEAEAPAEEEADSPLSVSIAVTSDYVWRGVSQTDNKPAFQPSVTYTAPVGVYVGIWASNVDFGSGDPDWEVDGYVGYNVDFSDNINFDVMYNMYTYTGASELNFGELITKTTFFENYNVSLVYSNDAWASGESGLAYGVGGSWELPGGVGLEANVNRNDFSSAANEFLEVEDYTDYNVSLSKGFGPTTLALGYYSTDSKGKRQFFGPSGDEAADGRVVFTLSVDVP